MGTTKKKLSAKEASEAILREMIIKFGVKFMADSVQVEEDSPLYVVLFDFYGEIKPTPYFPRRAMAVTFVELCNKYLPGFKNKKFRIFRLIAV